KFGAFTGGAFAISFYDSLVGQVSISFDAVNVNAQRGFDSGCLGSSSTWGTAIGSAAHGLTTGQWYWVAVEVTINGSTGSVAVWANGAQILNLTNVNTKQTGNA